MFVIPAPKTKGSLEVIKINVKFWNQREPISKDKAESDWRRHWMLTSGLYTCTPTERQRDRERDKDTYVVL